MTRCSMLTPGKLASAPPQLVALAVVAAVANGVNRANLECDQIVEDGAGRPRLAPNGDDVVNGKAGLDRRLGLRGIDMQIAVEKEIAHDADAQLAIPVGELVQSIGVHVSQSRR